MLTVDGRLHPAGDKNAVIGTYGAITGNAMAVRRANGQISGTGEWRQVNREGNSLD